MHSELTISAVIPAFNSQSCLPRAIESVLSQTKPVVEVLVVDDGSTDDTAAVAERFGPPVRVLRQSNAGPAAARNHGAREASGEWIALLDADDVWLPTKLERQAPLCENPRVGIVHCYTFGVADRFRYDGRLTFQSLWRQNVIGTSTVLVRKFAWELTGGFDEDRRLMGVEDYNFWLKLVARGWEVSLCPEPLAHYTPAADSLSTRCRQILEAELFNAERIAAVLGLPADDLRQKQADIYAEYADSMFWRRDMRAARQSLVQLLLRRPSIAAALRLASTFTPVPVIDRVAALMRRGARRAAASLEDHPSAYSGATLGRDHRAACTTAAGCLDSRTGR